MRSIESAHHRTSDHTGGAAQTTSPKRNGAKMSCCGVRWSAIWANPGTRQNRPPTTATFPAQHSRQVTSQQHRFAHPSACDMSPLVRTLRACMPRPHVGLLFRAPGFTTYGTAGLTCGTDRPTCETAAHRVDALETQAAVAHGQSMIDHNTHRPAMQWSERGKHDHPKSDFPARQAEKSPC